MHRRRRDALHVRARVRPRADRAPRVHITSHGRVVVARPPVRPRGFEVRLDRQSRLQVPLPRRREPGLHVVDHFARAIAHRGTDRVEISKGRQRADGARALVAGVGAEGLALILGAEVGALLGVGLGA